jgi:hypothetical protein
MWKFCVFQHGLHLPSLISSLRGLAMQAIKGKYLQTYKNSAVVHKSCDKEPEFMSRKWHEDGWLLAEEKDGEILIPRRF